jgi:peroxiredoxin (alkyl hydroperoxide reductase subunit C)
MGAEVVTVSCDTQFVHLAWQREEKELAEVKFQMGADPTGRLSRMFGIYLEDAGISLRGSYIIAPDGKLMNSEVNFLNMGRNIEELLRKFKANVYLSKKTNEGCPAKWKDDGDPTLTPGPEMVGRVHEALRS